ncbi:MAG TPA: hypothetical protein VGP47_09260 [Parachlamydiaceae bacterium]|nr:hypothetical protein [Parachlamydiaceae bacterium]
MQFFGTSTSYFPAYPSQIILDIKTKVVGIISSIKELATTNFSVYFDNSPQVRTEKALKVKELETDSHPELLKIINEWRSFAKTKADQSALLIPNVLLDNFAQRTDIFNSSYEICDKMHQVLDDDIEGRLGKTSLKVFTCSSLNRDNQQENIQAIAFTIAIQSSTDSFLYITFLASRPQNLVSPLNKHQSDCIAGAGSQLIKHLAEEVCPQSNLKEIKLSAGKTNIDFYKKIGFIGKGSQMILDIPPK